MGTEHVSYHICSCMYYLVYCTLCLDGNWVWSLTLSCYIYLPVSKNNHVLLYCSCTVDIASIHQSVHPSASYLFAAYHCYAPPSRVGSGWGLWRGVDPSSMPLNVGHLPSMENVHSHICVVVIWWKRFPCRRELDNCPVLPGRVGHNSAATTESKIWYIQL